MEGKLLMFPGNNLMPNKKWIEQAEKELKSEFPNTEIYYYNHWKTGEPVINFNFELNRLKKYNNEKNLMIFAKSAGVILVIKAIKEGIIHPTRCFFLGSPILWSLKNKFGIDKWIKGYKTPTLFIHNDKDPLTSSNYLSAFLKGNKIKNYVIHSLNGNSHDYDDFNLIKRLMEKFILTK